MNEICKFVQPEYVKKFQCSANKCEDTCCSGWTIYVDENAYKKCINIKNVIVKSIINESILKNKDNNSTKNYAYIKFNKEGVCPLLTDEGFCTLHLKFGEEYLGEVCNLYPRNIRKINNTYIQVLSLSCIEAARLCLLNSKGINFEEVDLEYQKKFDNFVPITTNKNKDLISVMMCIISIIQNGFLGFYERLLVLGDFMKDIENMLFEGSYDQIESILINYQNLIVNSVNKDKKNQREKIKFIFNVIDSRMNEGINNKIFYKFLQEFQKGFGLETEMELSDLIIKYNNGYIRLTEKILSKHNYIFENYIVNTVFKELIPLNIAEKISRAYFCLVLQYSLLQMFLIGILNFNEELNEEEIVNFIASFERIFPYNYIDSCYEKLPEELKDNLDFYKCLI